MTRARTKSPVGTPKPRKKLSLTKKTIRDLETRGRAKGVKGGMSAVRGSNIYSG